MTYWDVFQSILHQMDHEDGLLVARTQWLVISQFLLLLAFILVDRQPLARPLNLQRLLSTLGVVTTIFILAAILAAIKLFVELRTDMFTLLALHPDLPMRKLDPKGVGSGLLCPVLLSLALLYTWSRLTFPAKWAALWMTTSAALASLYIILLAHELAPGPVRTVSLTSSLSAAIASLGAALWLGMRSIRRSS